MRGRRDVVGRGNRMCKGPVAWGKCVCVRLYLLMITASLWGIPQLFLHCDPDTHPWRCGGGSMFLLKFWWASDYSRDEAIWLSTLNLNIFSLAPLGPSHMESPSWWPSWQRPPTSKHVSNRAFRWFGPLKLMSSGTEMNCPHQALPKIAYLWAK